MASPQTAEASVLVEAPPERVYDVVADVTRVPQWSPETYAVRWVGGAGPAAVGVRFKGSNRFGRLRWSMPCEVEVAQPGREFGFVTRLLGRPATRWRYRFEAEAGGTRVTESFSNVGTAPGPLGWALERLFARHDNSMPENLRVSLERLKSLVEAEVAAAPQRVP